MVMMRAIAAWFTARRRVIAAFLIGWVVLVVVGAGRAPDADQLIVLPDLGNVFLAALGVYAVLAFVMLLYLCPSRIPVRSRKTRRMRIPLVVTIFLVAFAIVFPPREVPEEEAPPEPEAAVTQQVADVAVVNDDRRGATSADIAGLALIILIIAAVLVRNRRRTASPGTNVGGIPDEALEADIASAFEQATDHLHLESDPRKAVMVAYASLEQATDHLHLESDPRKAVMVAYASLEQALVESGYLRDPAQTPTEYLASVLAAMPALADPAVRLAHLYELARFSDHAITNEDRDRAAQALAESRLDLGSSIGVTP